MTPFIVWHVPNFPPLATVYITDTHWPNKPREKVEVRTKWHLRCVIKSAKRAEKNGERFQYEIERNPRWYGGRLKSLDVATDEPKPPARLEP